MIAADGQKYGPANVQVLNEWIRANRVFPTTILEAVSNGVRTPANSVPGLVFSAPMPTPAPTATYASASYAPQAKPQNYSGNKEWGNTLGAIGLGALSIPMTYFIGIGMFICVIPCFKMAYSAITEDENWVALIGVVLGLVGGALYIIRLTHR